MNDERHKLPKAQSLDERFARHPHMYEQMQRIADMMEQAIANGATADEAEEMAIKQINELGRAMLSDWAKAKHDQSVADVKKENPSAIRNVKKLKWFTTFGAVEIQERYIHQRVDTLRYDRPARQTSPSVQEKWKVATAT
jgi:hypothetical protein